MCDDGGAKKIAVNCVTSFMEGPKIQSFKNINNSNKIKS